MRLIRHRFLCLLLAVSTLLGSQIVNADSPTNGIHVSGRGEIRVEPDIARFSLEVTRQGANAADLKTALDEVTADILKLAKRHKIDKKDVIAASVRIQPNRVYDDGRQRIDGVIASRSIQITLRDLTRIGDFMNAALQAGINNIGNVALDTSKRIDVESQALEAAIADSKAIAGRVASAYGVELGGLQNVTIQGGHAVQQKAMMAMDMVRSSSEESFSAGEIVVSRQVQASFYISGQ